MSLFPVTREPHILIVDDDRGTADLLRVMLQAHKYQISIAYSGAEAIESLEKAARQASSWRLPPVDLVLLDIMMPGVDGFKVCQSVKNHPLLKYIPVIMLTALDNVSDKIAAIEFGADDYITKPFLPQELDATIKAKLQVKEREEELLRRNAELAAINAVSAAAASTLDPQRVCGASLEALVENTEVAAGAIYRHDETQGLLRRVVQQGVDRPAVLAADDEWTGQVWRTQQPLIHVDLSADPDAPLDTAQVKLKASIGVPLQAADQSMGVLEVYHGRPYGLRERDVPLYVEIGSRIGVALENAEIFDRAQSLLIRSSVLGTQ